MNLEMPEKLEPVTHVLEESITVKTNWGVFTWEEGTVVYIVGKAEKTSERKVLEALEGIEGKS